MSGEAGILAHATCGEIPSDRTLEVTARRLETLADGFRPVGEETR